MRIEFLTVLCLVGCGDGGGRTALVTIETGRPPALIELHDVARAEWRSLAAPGASTFEVTVDGPYRIVVACELPGDVAHDTIGQYARTPEDEPSIHHECRGRERPFNLRGEMVQLGQLAFGGFGQSTVGPNRAFSFRVAPGSFDLVVLFGDFTVGLERIAIRRDVAITGDAELGVIDLAQEPTEALIPRSFTASNLEPGERMSASTILDTGSTAARLHTSSAAWAARLAPPGVLRETDRQRVTLLAAAEVSGAPSRSRHRAAVIDPAAAADGEVVALPEPLGPVTFEVTDHQLTATWSSLPAHDLVGLRRTSSLPMVDRSRTHTLTLSRAFLEATGATSATLDLRDVPGFQSEWRHDPALEHTLDLTASLESQGVRSGVTQRIAPTTTSGAPGPQARESREE